MPDGQSLRKPVARARVSPESLRRGPAGRRVLTLVPLLQLLLVKVRRLLEFGELLLRELRLSARQRQQAGRAHSDGAARSSLPPHGRASALTIYPWRLADRGRRGHGRQRRAGGALAAGGWKGGRGGGRGSARGAPRGPARGRAVVAWATGGPGRGGVGAAGDAGGRRGSGSGTGDGRGGGPRRVESRTRATGRRGDGGQGGKRGEGRRAAARRVLGGRARETRRADRRTAFLVGGDGEDDGDEKEEEEEAARVAGDEAGEDA